MGSGPQPRSAALNSGFARARIADVALVVACVLAVRAATFWTQVIDWDVGLYLVVAREILHGHLPYVTAWEYRPPGLFFLLAAALAIFHQPSTAMAVLGVVAVGATALALYAIGLEFGASGRIVGIVAALFYAFASIEDDGLAGNTELLFAPFIAWAMWCVVRAALRRRPLGARQAAVVGVLVACALQMKLMVLPEGAFVVVLAGWWAGAGAGLAALCGAVAIAPFALEAVLYAARGALGAFLDANLYASLRRSGVATTAPRDNLQRILAQPVALAPASVLALLAPFAAAGEPRGSGLRSLAAVLWAWLAVDVLTLLIVREFNDHQFLQLLPPLCLLGAYGTAWAGARLRRPLSVATLAVLVAFALHGYYQVVAGVRLAYHRTVLGDAGWHQDNVDRIAGFLRTKQQTHTLFVVGETPIVYLLADVPLPTRYPFSLYLTDPEMWPLTGVDGRTEVARILAGRPQFILRSDSHFHLDPAVDAEVGAALRERYRLVARFDHDALFELRETEAGGAYTSMTTSS